LYNKDKKGERPVGVKIVAITKDAYESMHKGILALAGRRKERGEMIDYG